MTHLQLVNKHKRVQLLQTSLRWGILVYRIPDPHKYMSTCVSTCHLSVCVAALLFKFLECARIFLLL